MRKRSIKPGDVIYRFHENQTWFEQANAGDNFKKRNQGGYVVYDNCRRYTSTAEWFLTKAEAFDFVVDKLKSKVVCLENSIERDKAEKHTTEDKVCDLTEVRKMLDEKGLL